MHTFSYTPYTLHSSASYYILSMNVNHVVLHFVYDCRCVLHGILL